MAIKTTFLFTKNDFLILEKLRNTKNYFFENSFNLISEKYKFRFCNNFDLRFENDKTF